MPEQELNVLQLPTCRMTQLGTRAPQIMRSRASKTSLSGLLFHRIPDYASFTPSSQHFPARQTQRNTFPPAIPAARTHASRVDFTQSGFGTVRMCLPLPTRSTMALCSSRCCRWANVGSASSRLLRPQPSKVASTARFLLPINVLASGACQKTAGLLRRDPVSKPHAQFFHALRPPNASGQFRAEQTRVCSLIG